MYSPTHRGGVRLTKAKSQNMEPRKLAQVKMVQFSGFGMILSRGSDKFFPPAS